MAPPHGRAAPKPTAATTTSDRPLDAEMRAIIARYCRVTITGAVILAATMIASVGIAVLVSDRPGLVPNQGEATIAAILFAVIIVPCLSPLLVSTIATLGRYAAIRGAREANGTLRVEQIGFWGKLTQFDPELRGTNFDYLRVGLDRVLLPSEALEAVAVLRTGTAIDTSGGAVLFEVRGSDGRVAYRCPGYTGAR